MTTAQESTICLVDGSGYIFRAFYALPTMTRPDGTPVNAVYGFLKMLMHLVREQNCAHIVVVFDAARRNFRNDIYPAYKQTRKEVPPDLIPQFPMIREACRVMNIPQIEMEGFEADDIIATYARLARDKGWQVQIISADKDLMQLVRDGVHLYDPMKRKKMGASEVQEKFGVPPEKVIDVQALMGDSIDNVPGANGIGPKTAAELINQFGSVENIYEHIEELKSTKRRDTLIRDKELVFISKKLVALNSHVPVTVALESFVARLPDKTILYRFLKENNFNSLAIKISAWLQKQADILGISLPDDSCVIQDVFKPQNELSSTLPLLEKVLTPPTLSANMQCLKTFTEWQKCCKRVQEQKECIFQIYTDEPRNSLTGVSIASGEYAFYIPFKQTQTASEADLFSFQTKPTADLDSKIVLTQIADWLKDESIHIISYHLKDNLHSLQRAIKKEIAISNYDDISIQNYILNGTKNSQKLTDMSIRELKLELPVQPTFRQKQSSSADTLSDEQITLIRASEASAIKLLWEHFDKQLQKKDKAKVYQKIELPLLPILFKMETTGILIDKLHLGRLNSLFTQEIDQTINQIYELAGEEFNINSPMQIATILFDKMGLEGGRKNAAGNQSTDVKVLEKLANDGVEIARLILKFRLFGKLKSTYIDALLHLSDTNNRVHTTFLQTITNTGRLSSTDPNLQNIPIRTPEGKEIRKAFVARPGYKIVCADYSQIELRLLADVANIKQLKESFIHNEDIHARTASQIFKIPLSQIDADTRRRAKAINFGIVYGISAFGLSNQLGISRTDASTYINAYLKHYPEIKTYMEQIEIFVKAHGYVTTPFGRICYIPGADHPRTRAFAVRAAINAPIQGGAADIIKLAMKEINLALKTAQLDATLLLQVHDELVFEVLESDVPKVMALVKDKMENAVKLSVPLIADVRAGENWKEAH